jgi:hypothetical protein
MAKTKTKNEDATNLDQLASSIKAEHEAVGLAVRKSLDHARKAGELLSKAKDAIKDTVYQWGRWVEQKCGVIERTANNYLRIHEKWGEIEAKLKDDGGDLAHLTVRAALNMLKTKSRTPKEQREPLTLTGLKERMAQHNIEGDPAELVKLLKELGVKVPLADDEDDGDEEDDESDEA